MPESAVGATQPIAGPAESATTALTGAPAHAMMQSTWSAAAWGRARLGTKVGCAACRGGGLFMTYALKSSPRAGVSLVLPSGV
jgi:hypothetical protein